MEPSWMHIDHISVASYLVSPHDCVATHIRLEENGDLIFSFPDGIWVSSEHNHNPYKQLLRTDAAELRLTPFTEYGTPTDIQDIVCAYEIRNSYLFRRLALTRRVDMDENKLAKMVNSGRWSLSFYNEYHSPSGSIFHVEIFKQGRKGNIHKRVQCELYVQHRGISYCWNNLRPDRPW